MSTEDFNITLSVLGEFDSIVRQHLESDWHRVGFKTKQLLKEIHVLRNILEYSIDYDAVTFYNYLKIQVEEAHGLTYHSSAYWLLSDSANVLIEVAKERACAKELNPKWRALHNIVNECELERKSFEKCSKPILIIAASQQSLVRLAIILSIAPTEYLSTIADLFIDIEANSNKRSKIDSQSVSENESSANLKNLFGIEKIFENFSVRNIILRTTSSLDTDSLRMINPVSIIMYSPSLEALRLIETYNLNEQAAEKVKVYFFMYSDSVEEQKYLTQIRREKEAFEKLIQTKAVMAPYHEEAGVSIEFIIEDALIKSGMTSYNAAIKDPEFPRKIIVDTRDLRSSLPFLLYNYGFEIDPLTIPVGDYILSPSICVERKSLPDLIQSLNSGRLYLKSFYFQLYFIVLLVIPKFWPCSKPMKLVYCL